MLASSAAAIIGNLGNCGRELGKRRGSNVEVMQIESCSVSAASRPDGIYEIARLNASSTARFLSPQ